MKEANGYEEHNRARRVDRSRTFWVGGAGDEWVDVASLVLLPGAMVIDDRDAVVESMQGDPWDSYDLQDERVMLFGDWAAVVAYRAVARRAGHEYAALCNSTYVRQDGQWKLALHQQTPI